LQLFAVSGLLGRGFARKCHKKGGQKHRRQSRSADAAAVNSSRYKNFFRRHCCHLSKAILSNNSQATFTATTAMREDRFRGHLNAKAGEPSGAV
jgi:hypothetical protein